MMKQTEWKTFEEHGARFRIRAEYGFDIPFAKKCNQDPHFTITGEIERQAGNGRWVEDGFGMLHDYIAKHFKQLRPLLKWHLCAMHKGPMHYVANAIYHLGLTEYKDAYNLDHFKSTIVSGVIPNDQEKLGDILGEFFMGSRDPIVDKAAKQAVTEWLLERLPQLMVEFKRTVDEVHPGMWDKSIEEYEAL